jgi:stage III sporulation protein AB
MQFLLYLTILIGCSYIGYGVGHYYVKRQHLLQNLISFASYVRAEIAFAHLNLENIVKTHIPEFDKNFRIVLKNYLKTLKKSDYITIKELRENVSSIYLEENELNEMLQFFSFLGKSDIDSQITIIDKHLVSFKNFLNSAKGQRERYSGMSKKLGFLMGILILIIML